MKTNTLGDKVNYEFMHSPKTESELINLIKRFDENNESYSVVSRGNNWGYGCTNSHKGSRHLIELSFLSRILDFDKENGLVTIEPGVSYGALCDFLQNEGNDWIAPVHGGGPNCSVVGNVLERGYGITPITDHFASCQSLKAILSNGKIYQSPFHAMGMNKLGNIFKYGIGPYLDGIFTQSNFGIVSQMTIRLAAKSEEVELFCISISPDELPWVVEFIKRMKRTLSGTLGGINLMNQERVLSMLIDYPVEKINSREPLTDDFLENMAKKNTVAPWTLIGALYGNKKLVKASKKIIKKELSEIKGRKLYLNKNKIQLLEKLARKVPRIFNIDLLRISNSLTGLLNILNGIPQDTALKLAYWKNIQSPPKSGLNPREHNCGIIWYAPLVEINVEQVDSYIKFVSDTAKKFNLNPLITLTTIDDLCFDSTIPILFNKDDEVDRQRAHDFFNTLLVEGKEKGYYPYRLGTNAMDNFHEELSDDYKYILNLLKDSFDSKRIYAEGRYIEKGHK
jgi:hypothetical protein